MNPQFRIKNHILLVALAAAYPVIGHAAGAARVEFVAGDVVAISAAGAQRELSRGAELQSGEAIRTGDNARAQLRFSDGGMMSLQPKTEFRIDQYNYDGKLDGQERGFFSLIRGGLRTISGLVGHGNHDNYKVTTSVATIGIRGTEYSAVFTGGADGQLNVATGEGAIQVCNDGGCVIISSGESAVVTGTTQPKTTPLRPNLPAPVISNTTTNLAVPYTPTETLNSSGTLALFGADLVTGPAYSVATGYAFSSEGYGSDSADSTSATFGAGSKLTSFNIGGGTSYSAGTVQTAFSIDGVIGWGYWSGGTQNSLYGGAAPLADLHYVVGVPTSSTDLDNLNGMTGTYQLIGYTNPTSTAGYTGSNVTGSLTANFQAAGGTVVTANVGFIMNGISVNGTATASMNGSTSASFQGSGSTNISGTMNIQGFFAGANASHAGLVYQIDGNSYGLGNINGAQAYKQTSVH